MNRKKTYCVTKEISFFPTWLGPNTYAFDCPGTGDADAKMSDVVTSIEKAVEHAPIHAVVLTCSIANKRIQMGAQLAAAVLSKGLLKTQGNPLNRVIVCGTQRDTVKEKVVNAWVKNVVPSFTEFLEGQPRCVVTTGLAYSGDDGTDPFVYDDWSLLKATLEEIYQEHQLNNFRLQYQAPDPKDLVIFMSNATGIRFATESEITFMANEIQQEREKKEKEIQALKQQYNTTNRNLTETMAQMQRDHNQQHQNFQNQIHEMQAQHNSQVAALQNRPAQVVYRKKRGGCLIS